MSVEIAAPFQQMHIKLTDTDDENKMPQQLHQGNSFRGERITDVRDA